MLIYKIFRHAEWQELVDNGTTTGAPIDIADGYIHISTPQQAPETAAKYFAGLSDLVLVALDAEALGEALRWEPSRGGALFPHLYRSLNLDEVVWHRPLDTDAEGEFIFPQVTR